MKVEPTLLPNKLRDVQLLSRQADEYKIIKIWRVKQHFWRFIFVNKFNFVCVPECNMCIKLWLVCSPMSYGIADNFYYWLKDIGEDKISTGSSKKQPNWLETRESVIRSNPVSTPNRKISMDQYNKVMHINSSLHEGELITAQLPFPQFWMTVWAVGGGRWTPTHSAKPHSLNITIGDYSLCSDFFFLFFIFYLSFVFIFPFPNLK